MTQLWAGLGWAGQRPSRARRSSTGSGGREVVHQAHPRPQPIKGAWYVGGANNGPDLTSKQLGQKYIASDSWCYCNLLTIFLAVEFEGKVFSFTICSLGYLCTERNLWIVLDFSYSFAGLFCNLRIFKVRSILLNFVA